MSKKTYIGDGVYAYDDGFHIVLETERENGKNLIALESQVLEDLFRYVERARSVKITVTRVEPEILECGCPVDDDARINCEECCEHGDVCEDERICLDCDKDMTETMAARAEAAADARADR